jgi:hypothetical protein
MGGGIGGRGPQEGDRDDARVEAVREIDVARDLALRRAWLAGFVDGEGTITIYSRKSSKKSHNTNYFVGVDITNTDLGVLKEIQAEFGGRLHINKDVPGRKRTYHVRLVYRRAESLLLAVKPYIRLKTKQLEVALRLSETILGRHSRAGIRRGVPFDPALIEYRRGLCDEIRGLNRRGAA